MIQENRVHTLPSHVFKISLNIIVLPAPIYSRLSNTSVYIFHVTYICCMSVFVFLKNIWRTVQIMNLLFLWLYAYRSLSKFISL
jgi:hypothetical protein